jgi:hypothetical protein
MALADKIILESSLSRVVSHIERFDVAMLSACRSQMVNCVDESQCTNKVVTAQENLQRSRDMKAALLYQNFGVTDVLGGYIEGYHSQFPQQVKERSFFVVNLFGDEDFFEKITSLGEQFCQDSVIIKPNGQDGYLYGTNNNEFPGLHQKAPLGTFKAGKMGEFFTKIGTRPFVFEHYQLKERMERMAIANLAKKYLK